MVASTEHSSTVQPSPLWAALRRAIVVLVFVSLFAPLPASASASALSTDGSAVVLMAAAGEATGGADLADELALVRHAHCSCHFRLESLERAELAPAAAGGVRHPLAAEDEPKSAPSYLHIKPPRI